MDPGGLDHGQFDKKPEEEESFLDKVMGRLDCSNLQYQVQACFYETRDWRKCQKEVNDFKKCIEEHKNHLKITSKSQ